MVSDWILNHHFIIQCVFNYVVLIILREAFDGVFGSLLYQT